MKVYKKKTSLETFASYFNGRMHNLTERRREIMYDRNTLMADKWGYEWIWMKAFVKKKYWKLSNRPYIPPSLQSKILYIRPSQAFPVTVCKSALILFASKKKCLRFLTSGFFYNWDIVFLLFQNSQFQIETLSIESRLERK